MKLGHEQSGFRKMQTIRCERLLKIAQIGNPVLVQRFAWHVLKCECGGLRGFLAWAIRTTMLGAAIRLQMFWRLKVLRMDPEADETWL